ncbi:hypothetical protein [Nonomuraea sp. NPDC050310]|uniref:hypothetical protein n=1 Tax=Nonomuraea sp. NPDC050310 TaxID=3154935 RepID=UPI0033CEB617
MLLDVGGYFAPALEHLAARFSGRLLGVVEDTQNGHQRCQRLDKPPVPVYSVARSPLKDPEDYLVGQSVVFSTEALVRSRDDILNGRPACVIGYGKLGRSIAAMLHSRHVGVTVFDIDLVRRVQALSQGYRTAPALADALAGAGLVVCATGNMALREEDFGRVANGAYIASVTSSDDELELSALHDLSTPAPLSSRTSPATRAPATTSTSWPTAKRSTSCTARASAPTSCSSRPRSSPRPPELMSTSGLRFGLPRSR